MVLVCFGVLRGLSSLVGLPVDIRFLAVSPLPRVFDADFFFQKNELHLTGTREHQKILLDRSAKIFHRKSLSGGRPLWVVLTRPNNYPDHEVDGLLTYHFCGENPRIPSDLTGMTEQVNRIEVKFERRILHQVDCPK